jgi:hypothetical protein
MPMMAYTMVVILPSTVWGEMLPYPMVDVHVSCSSQVDAQLAAFFIDPRAK